jgi:hypothetical protein
MLRRAVSFVMCLAVAAALAASPASHLHSADDHHEALLHTHFEAHLSSSATESVTEAEHGSSSVQSFDLFTANKVSATPVITVAPADGLDLDSTSNNETLLEIEQVRAHGPPGHVSRSLRAPPA